MTVREAGKVIFIVWPLQWETGEAEGSFVNGSESSLNAF